jgi:quinone-modifying oxidoreductase subunit QmoA
MEPNLKTQIPLKEIQLDEDGFLNPDFQKPGIYSTGTAKRPSDVNSSIQDATGTSLKAIQNVVAN